MTEHKPCWCGGRAITDRGPDGIAFVRCLDSEFHDPHATGRRDNHTTLYVAGPMTGYEDCNYPHFHEVAQRLKDAGYDVINPAEAHIGNRHHYVDLIREDLKAMLDCHGVAVLEHWWESTGARNEVQVAGILKMPVRPWAEWLERASRELA